MPFKVVRATVDDVPDIVRVHDEAFAADVMMSQLFIKVNPTVRKASNIAFFTTKFTQALVMGFEVWKAVDVDTGKLAGAAIWEFPRQLNAEQQAEKDNIVAESAARAMPEGANMALIGQLFGGVGALKKKYVDPTKHYYMSILVVDPAYQRQKIGHLLLVEGLKHVDEANGECHIVATNAGLGLYLKHGWEPIDQIDVDLEKGGVGDGILVQKYLKRHPQKSSVESN